MNSAKIRSLRFRLISATLSTIAVIWIAVAIGAWREATVEADSLFDEHLTQFAWLTAGLLTEDASHEIEEHLTIYGYNARIALQVWTDDGELLFHSGTAPIERLSAVAEGFSDSTTSGGPWRVFGTWDASHRFLVQAAESVEARAVVKDELAGHLLFPLVLALPLLAGALVWLIGANLAPLSRLAESIGQRSAERLDPIPLSDAPRELHPILEQLNRLFYRVGRSLEQEKRFTADAAHELRTPLAAMRTHAQVAGNSVDEGERRRSLDCLIEASDRTTHVLEQLLTLARVDATALGERFVGVDLNQAAAEAIAVEAPASITKSIELALEPSAQARVRGNPVLLAILLRNLIDNAVRYSPEGSSVVVSTRERGESIVLEVTDSGPGIAPEQRAGALERFIRLEGNREPGSGLGLSIVARIAEIHGARFELDQPSGAAGLCARVSFPGVEAG